MNIDSGTKRVLIVDDDPELTSLLNEYLTTNGYITDICHDGEAMFKKLPLFQPNIMILDIMLPGDDGLTLCQK